MVLLGVFDGSPRGFCQETEQHMNFIGNTYQTRLLLAALPKQYYEAEDSTVFERMMVFVSEDIGKLSREGIVSEADGLRYWVSPIAIKGDWPFLRKSATGFLMVLLGVFGGFPRGF